MSEYILELKNITKNYPGVKALDNVHFQLKKGEIHALMGENGAGKSTLIKAITGVHEPDAGEIILNGRYVHFKNPNDAATMSIAAIYQSSTAYIHLSVTENIFVGHEKITRFTRTIKWNEMHQDAKNLLAQLGANIDPRTIMGNLSVAEQQMVEIAKAVSMKAKILIMDEPTSALSNRECEQLYIIVEKLRDAGTSIIFISHRIEDMYRLATRVTVLRDGKYIGTWDVDKFSKKQLIGAMVGRDIKQLFPKKKVEIGEEVLKIENLSKTGYFKDISFSVRRGEILALTGLMGAGRSEVCQAIYGIFKPDSGRIMLNGKEVKFSHSKQALKAGIGFLPEDRQKQSLMLEWEIYKNISISAMEKYSTIFGINVIAECKSAKEQMERLAVKATSVYDKVNSLSGGNQQKVGLAKMLNMNLKVLIMDEPTKGIDVGAKAQIYSIISDLAEQGYAIVLVSSEMPEVLAVSDRVVVMREGRLTASFDIDGLTQEMILEAAMFANEQKVVS
jgi:rhamnose transport system ATP-binding protein